MRRPLSACAIGAVLSITLSAQPAGTSTFSEVLLQPSALPATGGALGLSVTISDTAGVQSAWVEVRYPDGNGSKTDLQRQGTNLSKAVWTTTVTIDRNWQESDQFLTLIFSTKNVLGKYSRSAGTPVRQAALPPDRPRIAVPSMPRYGTSESISGIVYNARPADYAAAILILVPGWGLVSKPYCSSILTGLNQFGRFSQAYATGGNDGAAVWLAAYLMPKNTRLDCINASGPATPYENAAAGRDGGFRDTYFPGKLVQFGGYDWQAKSTVVRADPGPNFFSSDSVSVDGQGMHFKVMRCHDPSKADPNARAWCAAEARLLRPAGYGTYTATLTGRLGKMAGDIAGGLFVYGDQVSYSHREIDLEFWQDSKDQYQHQYVVQPAGTETQKRYAIPADLTVATFRFRWEPERIVYTTWSGNAPEPTPQTQLATWTFDRTSSSVDIPPTGDQQVHFNLWIKKARNLANIDTDPEEEVIMNTFRYEPLKPRVSPVNVRNAAGYTGGAVSPGMLVSIFGYGLGGDISPTQWVQGDKAVTELAGTRVFFDGVPAPLTYAQWGQVNAVVPFSVRGRDTTELVVEYAGVRSDPIQLPVLSTLPGIFSLYATGIGQGAILNFDGTVNGPGNPISRGSYATLYVTGAGDYSPAVGDGVIIGNQNLPLLALPVKVTVGNVEARITYAGAAPGIVAGVAQINIQIPSNAPTGMDVPVVIQADNRPSQGTVSIAIQ